MDRKHEKEHEENIDEGFFSLIHQKKGQKIHFFLSIFIPETITYIFWP